MTSKPFIFILLLICFIPAQASAISVDLEGGSERYLFTGKELDKGTGLYYYGARYYKSVFATFTQPDTIIPDVYDPQSLNRYAYVRNNPLRYTDPTGNYAESVLDVISLQVSLALLAENPKSVWNWLGLAADVVTLATPGLFAGGTLLRGGKGLVDDAAEGILKNADNADEAAGAFSKLTPGGGLAAHEAKGGHLLSKHVGKSDEFLINRLKSEGVSATTFYNREVAEQVASDVIKNNQDQISKWLADPNSKSRLQLAYQGNENIGRGILKGESQIVDMQNAKVILEKTSESEYRIVTGYPIK